MPTAIITKRVTNRDAPKFIGNKKPFENHTKSLSGRAREEGGYLSRQTGRLNRNLAEMFEAQVDNHAIDYVVYSYSTPIAWYIHDTLYVVTSQKFSVTTSKQTSIVRMATDNVVLV